MRKHDSILKLQCLANRLVKWNDRNNRLLKYNLNVPYRNIKLVSTALGQDNACNRLAKLLSKLYRLEGISNGRELGIRDNKQLIAGINCSKSFPAQAGSSINDNNIAGLVKTLQDLRQMLRLNAVQVL